MVTLEKLKYFSHCIGTFVLSFSLVCVGSYLSTIVPVEIWVNERRAINAASGHIPNLDPGTVISLALIYTLVCLVVVFLVELMRWAWYGYRLRLLTYFFIGILAGWPVGYYFAATNMKSLAVLFLLLLAGVMYFTRCIWLRICFSKK